MEPVPHYKNMSVENIVESIEGIGIVTEEWKDITGYEGYYQVSNFGRVKSLPRRFQRRLFILAPHLSKFGYPIAGLCKNSIMSTLVIHRIVAKHFLENSLTLPEVGHKDDIRYNNRFDNLIWCTHLQNMTQAKERKRWNGVKRAKGIKCHTSVLSEEAVLDISTSKENGSALAKKYNVSIPAISKIRIGATWSHLTGIKFKKRTPIERDKIIAVFLEEGKTRDIALKYGLMSNDVNNIKAGRSYSKITSTISTI